METSASNNGQSQSPWDAHQAATSSPAHPEIPVIGAFVAGFVVAKVLKMIGSSDDE